MKLNINFNETTGKIKPMNAVNNGPVSSRGNGNLDNYIAANIPYARTHDASFYAGYGGYHTVDVHVIFPNFDADPYDPANYDFSSPTSTWKRSWKAARRYSTASVRRLSMNRRNTASGRRRTT